MKTMSTYSTEVHWLQQAYDVTDQHDAGDIDSGGIDAGDIDSGEIVVDLDDVSLISSEELNELIRLQSKIRHSGRKLVLENVRPNLWQVFVVTRLDRLLDIRQPVAS